MFPTISPIIANFAMSAILSAVSLLTKWSKGVINILWETGKARVLELESDPRPGKEKAAIVWQVLEDKALELSPDVIDPVTKVVEKKLKPYGSQIIEFLIPIAVAYNRATGQSPKSNV